MLDKLTFYILKIKLGFEGGVWYLFHDKKILSINWSAFKTD